MKFEVMNYESMKKFSLKVDGIEFNENTEVGIFTGIPALTAYILYKKYNAKLVDGGGNILDNVMRVFYQGKKHELVIGNSSHRPDNARHFSNVIISHMKKLDNEMDRIKTLPRYTFEV